MLPPMLMPDTVDDLDADYRRLVRVHSELSQEHLRLCKTAQHHGVSALRIHRERLNMHGRELALYRARVRTRIASPKSSPSAVSGGGGIDADWRLYLGVIKPHANHYYSRRFH